MTDEQQDILKPILDQLQGIEKRDRRVIVRFLNEEILSRATGRSTRQVDGWIQDFFVQGRCTIIDHSGQPHVNDLFKKRVLDRLQREHPQVGFVVHGNVITRTTRLLCEQL